MNRLHGSIFGKHFILVRGESLRRSHYIKNLIELQFIKVKSL